jgi:predicted DCC family thiol-disulfide oxidoreductase YuxK
VERFVLLYDRDCGFCRWSVAKVLAWDRGRKLRPVALQDSEAEVLLSGMANEGKTASWHLVAPDGVVRSAGPAAPALLRLLPGGRPLGAALARFPRVTERAYRLVADNRSVAGKLISGGARDRADARIAARA